MKAIMQPSKSDYTRYQAIIPEIREDVVTIERSLKRLGRNLKMIRDKRLYLCGQYSSFEEFCKKELGRGRAHAYRLIDAFDVIQLLLSQGIPEADLPSTERLCREIKQLPEDMQEPVWRAVLRQKKNLDRPVEVQDVKDAAIAEAGEENSDIKQRHEIELIQKVEGIARAFNKENIWFENMSETGRARLMSALTQILTAVRILIKNLQEVRKTDATIQS